ncbi:methyltransferase [Nostoc sp. 'Peltigera malacea cyanobiont' DB3992]|uniref:methyltransferase n=1 Tax=Nostoc sp. 'Peltigera malacea cyanobiont' DB3992 TaxID=1206980 RepID=UPI000C03F5AF|nr:methyltransferase [Nostoc sp. 'Peltigera malacea cyanobiont' DB3992]PHM11851.1 methyltransferase [Nostoc sp. 'Peltigera malacea cyanobiont' DB3992]
MVLLNEVWQKLQKQLMVFLNPNDLIKVSTLYAHDRWPKLRFAHRYQSHFAPLRNKKLKILAIGIGGYEDHTFGGEALKTWKKYFPNSTIYGLDIVDKKYLEEDRIKIFHGDQNDEYFIKTVLDEIGELDIVIEDGSAANEHHIKAFHTFFPALKDGGIYAAENIHHSYWPSLTGERWKEFAQDSVFLQNCINVGGSLDLNDPKTVMNMFKKMVDGLNHEEFLHPGYTPSYLDKNIVSMHFYHNLVIVYKGKNNEGSNFIENNTLSTGILELFGVTTLDELGLEFPKNNILKPEDKSLEFLQKSN